MRIQSFHHVALAVDDVERSARFYREVLGLPEQARQLSAEGQLRSVWMGLPDGGFVALEKASAVSPARAFGEKPTAIHLLAFRIRREDREPLLSELLRLGVPVEGQTRWTVYVRDPDGNRVGLSHHPHDLG